jgi:copper(I)-binding protein
MLRRRILVAIPALLAVPAARAQHGAAEANPPRSGDLMIEAPWTRAAGANGNGAGFMRITNRGTEPDRLVSATTDAARVIELHTHIHDGGVMRMRPVPDIPIPPGATVTLQPGGLHVMLIGLTAPLAQGTRVPLTLRFARAGEVRVMLDVQAAGARGAGGHGR